MKNCKIALGSLLLAVSIQSQAFTVGLVMPDQYSGRWYVEGFLIEKMMKEHGYNVELFYGGELDVELQKRQIVRLANQGVDALVIASLDGSALTEPLKVAANKKIPVISYDRLITGTPNVDYYVTFDNEQAGKLQGQFIIDALDLDNAYGQEPKTMEILSGSPDDNNSKFFYKGAMELLQPYIDAGVLTIPSNETSREQTGVQGWETSNAIKRTEHLLSAGHYSPTGKKLDAILSAADCLTDGVIAALKNAGYSDKQMPVITGQDATAIELERISKTDKMMTIAKPGKVLGEKVIEMLDAIKNGSKVPYNDESTYDNGAKVIKTYLSEPVLVTKKNYRDFS